MTGLNPIRCKCSAFSITDLLTLLAVLTILASLGFAYADCSRRKARLAVCVNNLQKVGRAVLQFSEEHGGSLPRPVPAQQGDLWWWYKEQIKSYAGLTGASGPGDKVFACPMDRGYSDNQPFCVSPRFDYGSYVFNGVTLPGLPNIAGRPVSSIPKPTRTLLVMEWSAHAPLSWHRSRTGRENAPFYCDALSVAAFVDGHVGLTKIYYDGYSAAFTRDPIPGYDYQFSGN